MFASKDLFFSKPSGGYQISRSVRLRSSASAYFNRTLTTPTSNTTWTLSLWIKRGALSTNQGIISAGTSAIEYVTSTDTLRFYASGPTAVATSTAVYRDPSAWGHWVITSNGTTVVAYYNNVSVLSYTGTLPQFNSAIAHNIGRYAGASDYFDGYMTEINFIDGQALTPSSFGQTNSVTGVWQPIKYGGTYGTNGFYLNFSDNSNNTATTIGKDYSGNGNNWTPNNISVTAGATYDSMLDVPTLYADGGNGRGNYCTWSPLGTQIATYTTSITNGNLTASYNAATNVARINGTLGVSSGKWYFEFQSTAGDPMIGFATTDGANAYVYDGNAANKRNYAPITSGSPTSAAYGATWNTTNIIGVALDLDAGTLVFYKDNVSQGTAYTSLSGTFTPIFGFQGGTTVTGVGNFGQRPFSYTPPTGFVALNTQNLPTPTISNGANYMAATTYTGTGATQTIANSGNNAGAISFQPDFVWVKGRSGATDHALYDSVRGTTKDLVSNSTAAETTQATGLTAFGSTGFTIGALAKMNTNAATYVGWQWKASGSTVSNTSGSITSTVSAGATQGFSVLTYTGTGSAATVGHGLGVAPRMMIMRSRTSTGSNGNWVVYHASLGATNYLVLNDTAASVSDIGAFNNTSPTSSVFSVGTFTGTNGSSLGIIAYCFAPVAGYSAFGSYTGNGSADGVFVYLGFRPRWLMIGPSSNITNWTIIDTSRDTYNLSGSALYANLSNAETSVASGAPVDILSNGFKWRTTSQPNTSGQTYIYAAFAEVPFKSALGR